MANTSGSSNGVELVIDIAAECHRLLGEAGITTSDLRGSGRRALAFEGGTVLGFALIYQNVDELRQQWRADSDSLIAAHQLALRRAQAKAWNTYLILLAHETASYAAQVALSAIEEDLTGTRKVARGGIVSADALRIALLPLLPIQNSPRLEAVDMRTEIQLRTTELPSRTVAAFLSTASVAVVAQTLEEAS
jgi:hypothetical protein